MKGGLKVAVFGIAASIVVGVVAQVNATCPGLLERWPELLTAGVLGGIGVWVRSPKDMPK